MRTVSLLCVLGLLAVGCSPREADLRGTLAEGWPDEPLFVWVEGQPQRVEVLDDTFALSGLPAGPARLTIASEDHELARVEIRDLPADASLSLERIRREEERDLAFPSAVRLRGADVITVNGVRMADPDALPERVVAEGVVLALGRGADALIVRPRSADLPDLPVVVTPETRVTDPRGEDAPAGRLAAGEEVLVEGRTASGYLLAERIRLGGSRDNSGPGASPPADRATGDASSRADGVREAERDPEDRGRADERSSAERGGRERGRARIPEGHRPPPGECRDWDPSLPPGQQKPPRKC